jgi:hypothetical protein
MTVGLPRNNKHEVHTLSEGRSIMMIPTLSEGTMMEIEVSRSCILRLFCVVCDYSAMSAMHIKIYE